MKSMNKETQIQHIVGKSDEAQMKLVQTMHESELKFKLLQEQDTSAWDIST